MEEYLEVLKGKFDRKDVSFSIVFLYKLEPRCFSVRAKCTKC